VLYRFGNFVFDPREGLLRSHDGAAQRLQPKVARLLELLLQTPGRLITHDELLDTIWPDAVVNPEALSQTVSRLRRALGETRAPRHIETLHKRGYRFVNEAAAAAEATEAAAEAADTGAASITPTTLHHDAGALRRTFPTLTIAAHPCPARVGEVARLTDVRLGERLALSRLELAFRRLRGDPGRPLEDLYVSRAPVELSWQDDALLLAPAPTTVLHKDGARVTQPTPIDAGELARGVTLELADRVALVLQDAAEPRIPRDDLGLIGSSYAIGALRSEIRRLGRHPSHALVSGPAGADLLSAARALAVASDRGEVTVATADDLAACLAQPPRGVLAVWDADRLAPALATALAALDPRRTLVVFLTHLPPAEVALHPTLRAVAAYPLELPRLARRRADVGPLLVAALASELGDAGSRWLQEPMSAAEPWLPAHFVARMVRYEWPGDLDQLHVAARQLAFIGRDGPIARLPGVLEELLPRARDAD